MAAPRAVRETLKGIEAPPTPSSASSLPASRGRGFGHASAYKGLSMQTLLDLNDIPELANEPGPGHYFGPGSEGFSALGPQRFSKCPSAPAVHFPKTGWDSWRGVVISKGHSGAFVGRDSPGAVYEVPGTLSKSAPKIGTSLRPDLSLSLGVDPHGSPGPGINVRDAPGASIGQAPPPKGRVNKGFGLAARFADSRHQSIGPGQYARKDSALNLGCGRSIGTGRASWEKVLTPGADEFGKCKASPGPGPPLWHDFNSGSIGASMGRAERFPRSTYEHCSPGPAAYDAREVGTRSPGQCWFGKQPTKPRFRQILAANTAKRGSWGYH